MEALLTYWLKANAVLALFAATYYALLRGLTFFQLNRAYLLLAVAFAAVYPLLPVPALLPPVAAGLPLAATGPAGPAGPVAAAAAASSFGWWQLIGAGYLAGVAGLLLRLLGQLLSLGQLWRQSRPAVVLGQAVRVVPGAGSPFSFGRTIYLPESALADTAALPATLRHEQAHVGQGHTLDVLLQVATALAWPNPAAWLLRRLALDNLEYLADQAALRGAAFSTREYQYLLLRQQAAGPVPAPALAFHFSFLSLKNRVLMLNHPFSAKRQLGRYLLAAPLLMLLALGYSGARAQTGPTPVPARQPLPANLVVYLDGKQIDKATLDKTVPADLISNVQVLKPAQAQQVFQVAAPTIIVTTKTNAASPEVLAFNKRVADVAPMTPATPAQERGMAAAKAYMEQHYPAAKMQMVGPVPNQENRYQAVYEENGKRWQLFFDGEGHVVAK